MIIYTYLPRCLLPKCVVHHVKLMLWQSHMCPQSMTFNTKPELSAKRQNIENIRYQWSKNKISIWMCATSSSSRSPTQRVDCN
jgi:hypothetical protein